MMTATDKLSIAQMVEMAAKLLPSQSPLHAFVHHNTLHAYEHLPFKQALKEASKEHGAEPFMSEKNFLEAINSGRILTNDIKAVLEKELDDIDQPLFAGAPTRRAILLWRLTTLFNVPNKHSVNWWLHEKGYLHKPHALAGSAASSPASSLFFHSKRQYLPGELEKLWVNLEKAALPKEHTQTRARPKDLLLERFDVDTDEQVKPFLIRYAAAYLDQGVGSLPQPDKAEGFLISFRRLHNNAFGLPTWLRRLPNLCRQQEEQGLDGLQVIADVMDKFGVPALHQQAFINESLKMLKGWAGMFRQFEKQPDKVPVSHYPATLIDFLAVQLLVEFCAYEHACKLHGCTTNTFAEYLCAHGTQVTKASKSVQDIYEAFITAQAFVMPSALFLNSDHAVKWVTEIGRFNSFERRYLLQLAYERRHRQHILDGLAEHRQFTKLTAGTLPSFQAVFCMDEREESTRRHLEELDPEVMTLGFAGFFGVAIQYQGLDDVTARPLCPVNRIPEHFVREVALNESEALRYQRTRKLVGSYSKSVIDNEAVFAIGPFWSLLMGIAKTPSLVFRSLVPRQTEKVKRRLTGFGPARPKTRLKLFRDNDNDNDNDDVIGKDRGADKAADTADGFKPGYTVAEAADAIFNTLSAMGLTKQLSPIIVIVGHGSSSLNNPHEAAHDCGATGGGRGGPNARAFAAMANHAGVRTWLKEKGIAIAETNWFVGAYHNTCDDSMSYYDLDLIPAPLNQSFLESRAKLAQACKMDALERCRKFNEVPVNISADRALGYAYQHANDLAQPRPEYGHATNAVCIIGRRAITRGLFLDRRSFLISYDPDQDPDKSIVAGILESAGPVGAGINLEYYFSFVDPIVYGCGTKLPHNISGLVGVMEGHCSDLRTGLPWQMVEIHEPVRLLTIVEATPEVLLKIAQDIKVVGDLVGNAWIQLVSMDPDTGKLMVFKSGVFVEYVPDSIGYPVVDNSETFFRGSDTYLGLAHINHTQRRVQNA
jgi:uncharacterized protein YbcC (UPF0753/DUF2309 family)